MDFYKARLRYLLQGYMTDQLTSDELLELKEYVSQTGRESELDDIVDDLWREMDSDVPQPIPSDYLYRGILADPKIAADPPTTRQTPRKPIQPVVWRWTAGIAALLCVAILLLYNQSATRDAKNLQAEETPLVQPILPGSEKATLTLANGTIISLDETNVGGIVEESGIRIVKTEDGQLFYEPLHNTQTKERAYNVMSTPKGGEYRIVLPDGTKVWLNAASTLTYPTRFADDRREVVLEGEAYFEVVAKRGVASSKENIPFIVKTATQTIEVLGTQFNVNAYKGEGEERTTLLEGSVKVSANMPESGKTAYRLLNPNEQATIRENSGSIAVIKVDPANAVAWKNGYFAFQDAHISMVMNIIARWYDIEVVYQGDVTNKYFGGTISRFEDFETLLKTIELTGSIRFRIEGRRVYVMT